MTARRSMGPTRRSTTALTGGAGKGVVVCHLRGSHRPQRHLWAGGDRQHAYQGAPLRRRWKRGAFEQALGTSRGGRTSKLHAATDETGRPRLILLTAGNASDAATAPALLAALGPFRRLVADCGYDSDAIRRLIAERGAEAVIPPSSPRVRQIPYDRTAYRLRNLVERLWCRLKDWRRVATRYDKLARNYLASVYLAALIIYWIN